MRCRYYLVPLGIILPGVCVGIMVLSSVLYAADWTRFRGPNGTGATQDSGVPLTWSDSEHVKWKTELPGPGFSSPIVVGDKVFVTSFSGYGGDREDVGEISDLKRHLVCVSRTDGKILWSVSIAAVQPEDPWRGPGIPTHGYASQTPVSDGERVYVFFGKTGVVAFDMDGNQLWQTSVGTDSDRQRWGSAASPILSANNVIVNASAESRCLIALDKNTGQEVWRTVGSDIPEVVSTWATPILMDGPNGKQVVIAMPGEVWGVDPQSGDIKWYTTGHEGRGICASLVAGDGVVYCIGGNPSGSSFAVRTGGSGDVSSTNVAWSSQGYGRISTPVLHDGHLYGANRGVAYCVDAETGERVSQTRLATGESVANQEAGGGGGFQRPGGPPQFGQRPGGQTGKGPQFGKRPGGQSGQARRRFAGGGGGGGRRDYSSPVLVGDKVYLITASGTTYVFAASPDFTMLATNRIESDDSGFNGTPAISNGELFLRSNKFLYCVDDD